jgi:hypothetical protein
MVTIPPNVCAVGADQVQRTILRPDLRTSEDQVTSKSEVDEIDQLRAAEYGLLSLLLGKAPDAIRQARCNAGAMV